MNELQKELKIVLSHVFNILNLSEDLEIDEHVADFVNSYYKDNQEFLHLNTINDRYCMSDKFRDVCMKYLNYDPE
jgi:hypothetical protein